MNNNKKPSKIVGIQFSLLGPKDIYKGSVAEIVNRDTYINNRPVIGGLFDPRMGVLDPGLICPSDGLDYIDSPGYFGHIKLARPVYYIQYLGSIQKILRCVCLKCSKVLINKEKHNHLLELPNEQRWNKIFALASKKKRCGEDSHNGCGCLQPKIKKEGLSTIVAEWNNNEEELSNYEFSKINNNKLIMKLTPELVLKIFKKISNEDIKFLGFDNIWSKPEWMICQVLAVPPPSMRPSVKHDAQQRSEDDLTHIIINIIKSNKTLSEKIEQKANNNVIDDWTTVLQYYVATLVDNKIPGVAAVAQRSGRPLKAIKERLNGKTGRVRGNLMGKRVDFSARSVITPDPNLSIIELGIPLKIAKNLSKPITVNKRNKNFLKKLVINGPDVYPGAKIYEKKNGETISLRYVDRDSIVLEDGDIVHRHLLNNDNVLFNRQPTLHRMSMMCHKAVIMNKGDTFRLNVADTKPYNADFDGDEMNLHMPQDVESEIELKNLAAVQYQIISPANNKSIVGIFQDSLLGAYRLTRENINFTHREAMNLLMLHNNVDVSKMPNTDTINSFELLSQIMPPITLKHKTSQYGDNDDYKTSNSVLEIENGKYMRGQLDKGTFGDNSRGLLQRICNDFGNSQVKTCAQLNVKKYIADARHYFLSKGRLSNEEFRESNLEYNGELFTYNGITSKRVIMCQGVNSQNNKIFDYLPIIPNKGELIDIRTNKLPNFMLSKGVFTVPIKENKFRVGSTYNHKDIIAKISLKAKNELLNGLNKITPIKNLNIIEHKFGFRPTTIDRKPIMGAHPEIKNMYIFNGMGSKGVLMAPLLSKELLDHILRRSEINSIVNVNRFFKKYSLEHSNYAKNLFNF